MSTVLESNRKSVNSLEMRNDFWEFYTANKKILDKIFYAQVSCYREAFDVDDLYQEIFFKLHKNNVLGQYDPTKSNLNTYITQKIKNYIRHTLDEAGYTKFSRSPKRSLDKVYAEEQKEQTEILKENLSSFNPQQYLSDKKTNLLIPMGDDLSDFNVSLYSGSDEYDTLDEIIFEEKLLLLQKSLTPTQWLVFCRVRDGMMLQEIATEIGVTVPWVCSNYVGKIKAAIKKIFDLK